MESEVTPDSNSEFTELTEGPRPQPWIRWRCVSRANSVRHRCVTGSDGRMEGPPTCLFTSLITSQNARNKPHHGTVSEGAAGEAHARPSFRRPDEGLEERSVVLGRQLTH